MSTKYTPGPWTWFDELDMIGVTSEHPGVFGGDICYAPKVGANSERPREQDLANAQLLAAAPDLASALRSMIIRDYPSTYIANQSARIKAGEQPKHAVGYGIAALIKAGVL